MIESYSALIFNSIPLIGTFLLFRSSTSHSVIKKCIDSMHGLFLFLGLVFAMSVSSVTTYQENSIYLTTFYVLIAFAYILLFISLTVKKQNKWLYIFHVYNLVYGLGVLFIGVMAITHDWL